MGEMAALAAAMTWSMASLLFERFGRSAGGLALNTVKCLIALLMFGASLWVLTGRPWPVAMSGHTSAVLAASGIVGLTIGDTFWFACLLRLGARRALLLFTVAPPFTAILGALLLDEPVTLWMGVGMAVTLAGIAWVILERAPAVDGGVAAGVDGLGVVFGVLAAACQAGGAVLTKLVGTEHTALEVSLVRIAAGAAGLALVVTLAGRWPRVRAPFRSTRSGLAVVAATFLGSYLGIWLMNTGFLRAVIGVAATLNSTSPIFVLPLVVVLFGERLSVRAVAGAVVAVAGVALLFLAA